MYCSVYSVSSTVFFKTAANIGSVYKVLCFVKECMYR